jgi:hypothetical protein
MRGIVGGHFSVLNGLVKGNCKFEVTLGHECELARSVDDLLGEIKVISELTPAANEDNVNVFNEPQALFNMAVEKEFDLVDDSDVHHTFRIKLDYFKLLADGKELVGTLDWNNEHEVAAFNSYEILPPKKDVAISVQVSFEEFKNGGWQTVTDNGKPLTENMTQTFKTGEAPDYIPLTNIDYTYPILGQVNFYTSQSSDGYIKLIKAQPYLFQVDNSQWKQVGRFTNESKEAIECDYIYTYSTNVISFKIPTLKGGQLHSFELVNKPAQQNKGVDRNVSQVENKITVNGSDSETAITSKQADGTINNLQEKSIFASGFRSSKYATFDDKINAQKIITTFLLERVPLSGDYLNSYLRQDEPFDDTELNGSKYSLNTPLISIEADLSGNKYYNDEVYPLVYKNYPIDGDIKVSRNTSVLGLPPVKAVAIFQNPDDFTVTNDGVLSPPTLTYNALSYQYDLPYYMALDFGEIQQKIVTRYIYNSSQTAQVRSIILATMLPTIKPGDYKINIKYTLPGSKSAWTKPVNISFSK